jgi:hypothetical protein
MKKRKKSFNGIFPRRFSVLSGKYFTQPLRNRFSYVTPLEMRKYFPALSKTRGNIFLLFREIFSSGGK